jgi:hypothetical protein
MALHAHPAVNYGINNRLDPFAILKNVVTYDFYYLMKYTVNTQKHKIFNCIFSVQQGHDVFGIFCQGMARLKAKKSKDAGFKDFKGPPIL